MVSNLDEDIYWWNLFCHGEKNAMGFFYKKYYNLLYNYGLRFLNDPLQIQDIIQDLFYKLCKGTHMKEVSNPKVYLLKSLRHLIYDYCVKHQEVMSIEDMEFQLPEEDHIFQSFFGADDEEVKKWKSVLSAIQELPNQQKQILYLFYIKGLSHKEIAILLDINPQSSMNSISKSLKRLRSFLQLNKSFYWLLMLGRVFY